MQMDFSHVASYSLDEKFLRENLIILASCVGGATVLAAILFSSKG